MTTKIGDPRLTTYDSDRIDTSPGMLLAGVWARRDLVWTLASRDARARYQQSILGIYWTILNPLATAAVFTVVFSMIAGVPVGQTPYAVFVLCGLAPWSFFANTIVNASGSLIGMAGLLTKVGFPREVLPLAAVLARLVDLAVSLAVVLLVLAWYGLPLRWTVLLVPLPLAIEIVFVLGLGLLLGAANLFYRDVNQLLGVALSLWIFLTPVVYPLDRVPASLRPWIALNPLTPVVTVFRDLILGTGAPDLSPLLPAAAVSLVVFVLGYALFKRLEPLFAETV
jgi:ABC-type polysaccharide/polyol phosphate export permease